MTPISALIIAASLLTANATVEFAYTATDGRPGVGYELGGPEVLTFKQILEYILAETGRNRPLVPVPFSFMKAKAWFLQLLPKPLLTVDQVTMLETDNIVSEAAQADGRTLAAFGITPQTIEAIVPAYLERFRKSGQFERNRMQGSST